MAQKRNDSGITERQASAQYILDFYENINALNQIYAIYKSTSIELGSYSEMQTDAKENYINLIHNTRNQIERVYIMLTSINATLKTVDEEKQTEIKKIRDKIDANFIINHTVLEDFVLLVNEFLLNQIIQKLLENSRDVAYKLIQK